jgi:tetratricopeptide (TPR) repeat protein
MKKYAIAAALLVALSASAQKDELKALKKLDQLETPPTAAQIKEYNDLFAAFESKIGNATDEQKNDFYYYRGTYYLFVESMMNPANALNAITKGMDDVEKVLAYEKTGKKKYTQELTQQSLPELKVQLMTIAQQLGQQKMFKEAGSVYALAYRVDPKDPANLYNAAASAVNSQDYDNALKHYLELDRIGYTGVGTVYSAVNVKDNKMEYFPNKQTRDLAVQQKLYTNPKDEILPSVKGEIVKNIALIYQFKGEDAKAKEAFVNARKANPGDVNLLTAEADLYLKANDMETYKKLISEATQRNPNNADLFYNLGVVTSKTNSAEAIKHYEKALAINPNHVNANINMGSLLLEGEKKIVNEMNSLGTSAKDNKRYDELKKQRDDMFKKAIPYFETALKKEPENEYAIGMLAGIYQALDRPVEAKALKARLKQ